MEDEIIKEMWRIKIGRATDFDVRVLSRELMELQAASHEVFVDRSGPVLASEALREPKVRGTK